MAILILCSVCQRQLIKQGASELHELVRMNNDIWSKPVSWIMCFSPSVGFVEFRNSMDIEMLWAERILVSYIENNNLPKNNVLKA